MQLPKRAPSELESAIFFPFDNVVREGSITSK